MGNTDHELISFQTAVKDIEDIIRQGRTTAYQAISTTQILMNWNIGKRIVEEEQHGKDRAEYGKQLLSNLSAQLVKSFGLGYSERNLRNFRQFYLYFPDPEIWNACVPNLNWTHFRSLLRVSDEDARLRNKGTTHFVPFVYVKVVPGTNCPVIIH